HNFQAAAELPDSFLHPSDSNSEFCAHIQGFLFPRRYALALIFHFHLNFAAEAQDANCSHRAPGMTVNICKALLDHAKKCCFHFLWEPTKTVRDVKINLNLAAFRKSFQVHAKGRGEADFIKQWRMEQ